MLKHLKIINIIIFTTSLIVDLFSKNLVVPQDNILIWFLAYKIMKGFLILNFNPFWLLKSFNTIILLTVVYLRFKLEVNLVVYICFSFDLFFTFSQTEYQK